MKKITLLLMMLLTSIINAQIASYSFSQGSGTYTPLAGGTVIASYTDASTGLGRMDDQVYNLPAATIPFTFTYNGVGYDGLNVSSNGFITFGATAPGAASYVPLSAATAYAGAISAFGRDLEGGYVFTADRTTGSLDLLNVSNLGPVQVGDLIDGTGIPAGTSIAAIAGSTITLSAAATTTGTAGIYRVGGPMTNIQYGVEGIAPNRTFIVQYSNFKRFGTTLATVQHMMLNYQIRLNETSNTINVVYGNCSAGLTTFATVNQVGLRGATNAFATDVNNRLNVKGTSDWATSIQGTVNTSGEVFNNVAPANIIATGLTYTWSPPLPCSGTPVGGIVTPASLNLCTGSAVGALVASGFTTGVAGITFQWEESPDGTTWTNAVGGTGATTATYTPPVYSGTPIQYRLNVTCTNSGFSGASAPSLIGSPATPSTQVSNANATNLQLTAATINWTVGNGGRRVVILSDAAITDPTDGNTTALVANAVYAGSGQQIMYDGVGATVNVSGLTQNTSYFVKVYEYLRCGTDPYDYYYNVTSGTNAFTLTTPVPPGNDDCAGAIPLTVGNVFADNALVTSNVGASASEVADPTIPAPGCSIYSGGDVWHSVVVPITGNLKIETSNSIGSTITDTGITVYSGVCGALVLVECDDDDSANGFFSFISLTGRTPGEVLYIRSFEYENNAFGDFQISAYDCESTLPAPTGDAAQEFCNSGTVADLVATGTAIKWYDAETLGNLLLSTDALVSGNIYYASQTVVCEGLSRLAVTVTITPTPADPTGAAAQTFCSTGSPDLTTLAVTSGGTGIVWYDAATLGNVLLDTTVLTATTYYAASVDGTCESTGRLAITTTENCPPESCLNDDFGQWPGSSFVPDNAMCDGITTQEIVDDGFASEYSMVTVVSGETYIFASSNATDIITIGTSDGATAYTSGVGSVTWVATISGDVRFYTHLTGCVGELDFRSRLVTCGTPSTDLPDYVNLQSPSILNFAQGGSGTVYGQVYEGGLTDVEPGYTGQAAGITVWVGISPEGSNTNPNTWTDWTPATWNSFAAVSNNDEYQATIGATLTPGTYYYATRFRLNSGAYVYGGIDAGGNGNFWNGTTHNSGVLTVTPPPAPANDECAGAIALTPGGVFSDNPQTGTTVGATLVDGLIPSCQANVANNVWYSVVVPASGSITIETGTSGSAFNDSIIVAFSGTCGALTEIDCDDDSSTGFFSLLTLTGRTEGEVIYVGVYRFSFNGNGTDDTFQVSAYDGSLATTSFDSANFTYYPNPVKNILNLSYTQNISSVAVFNLLGQQVVSKVVNTNQSQIDMSELPTGAYLVKVTADNQVKTIKVIKE